MGIIVGGFARVFKVLNVSYYVFTRMLALDEYVFSRILASKVMLLLAFWPSTCALARVLEVSMVPEYVFSRILASKMMLSLVFWHLRWCFRSCFRGLDGLRLRVFSYVASAFARYLGIEGGALASG